MFGVRETGALEVVASDVCRWMTSGYVNDGFREPDTTGMW
jgi:hypothetical protein